MATPSVGTKVVIRPTAIVSPSAGIREAISSVATAASAMPGSERWAKRSAASLRAFLDVDVSGINHGLLKY